MEEIGPTKPDAGVIATSPATAPLAAPRTVGLPFKTQSITIHERAAAAAAVLVTTVIGRASRGSEEWLYLDAGVFNAVFEASQGIRYQVETERKGPRRPFTLAGPSCDTVDTIDQGVMLPKLQVGDRVYLMNAGAYTLSYASHFNGFPPPPVYFRV